MWFFSKKKYFWLQNQKIWGKCLQPLNSNRLSTNISKLESRDRSTHGRETEQTNLPLRSRAGIRSIFGNTCVCKLPVRQCTELADGSKSPELAGWAELQRCKLKGVCTSLLPLAYRVCNVKIRLFRHFLNLIRYGQTLVWVENFVRKFWNVLIFAF